MSRRPRMTILAGIVTLIPILMTPTASAQGGTVIASDNFNRSNETPFSVGTNWGRTIAGNYDGVSNLTNGQVTSVSNEGIYYWQGAGTFSPTRQFARQRVVQKDGELGLVLLGGPDQAIMVGWGPPGVGDTVYIYWYSNGLDRGQLATGPSTLVNGDLIEAVLEGGVIYAKVNGVTVKSVANTTTLTTGSPGFITYLNPSLPTQVSILDDWEAGTPPSYTIGGTITEYGFGLSGVLVTASGGFSGSATTGGTGAYLITEVPPDSASIDLTPTLSGHTMSPLARTVLGPVTDNVTGEDFTSTPNSGAILTIHASHGSVTKDPDEPLYVFGTNVTLTPFPDAGYEFVSWSGDVPPGHATDDPLQVTMDQDRTITANFTAPDVVASDGFNRPNETPLLVGGNWQRYVNGGFVNLTSNRVAGASGDALYYWQGAGTFDSARQFARVKVVQAGGQVGLVLLGTSNQGLVAAWNAGTLYIYWYAAGSYQGNLTTVSSVLLDGDVIEARLDGGTVSAKINGVVVATVANTTTLTSGRPGFESYLTGATLDDWEAGTPQSHTISGTITENATGLSGVLVTASGGFSGAATTGVNGVYTIAGVPLNATSIVLTPTLSGHTMSPLTRTVPGPVTGNVTGEDFTSTPNTTATLTVQAAHGSVTKNPDQLTYTIGTEVTLTPIPDAGYNFASWSGDVPVGHATDNPLIVTMDQDRNITANFTAPDVIASDAFNRADETPLVVGGNWQRYLNDGFVNLTSNHVAGVASEALYYWQGAGTFNNTRQFSRVRVVQAGGQVGLVLLGASNQALVVAWSGGTLYIYWYSGGSYQGNLATVPSAIQNGDIIEASLDGGTVYAKINGAVVASVANTTTLTSGRPGFETYLAGASFDDWEAGTPQSYTISGTITENAAGLSGVLVTASGGFSGSAITNINGVYTIAGVPPNATSIVLTPTLSGHTMSPLTRTVLGPVTDNVTGEDFTSTPNTTATLTVQAIHGSVTKNPDQVTYALGTNVTLTPVPDAGYNFANWTGDVPAGHATDNPLIVTMNQDRTITAVFVSQDVVAADYFERANETPLVVGGNWQRYLNGGFVNLTSNHVAGASGDALYYWQGGGTFDNTKQFARVRVVDANGQVGLVLLGTSSQALVVAWSGGTLYIYWYSGGAYQANLTTASSTLQNGDVIEAVLDGGTVYAKINGVVVTSVANTTTLTSGRPGFETYLTGASFDDWEAGTPVTGSCAGASNGTPCNDGNACTQTDTCQAGVCVGANPVVCSAIDQCHIAGTCDTGTGVCSNPTAANGTSCTDNNACTTGDTCQAGACTPGTAVTCNTPSACHTAVGATCDSGSGACTYPSLADGTSCADADACNGAETCQAGSCTPGTAVTCNTPPACHTAVGATCDSGSGACTYPSLADGTSCADADACNGAETCQAGSCTPGTAVTCNTPPACHTAVGATCDSGSGACTYPALADGTSCADADACNGAETCQAGSCTPGTAVTCNTPPACHTAVGATCDSGSGACTYPSLADGTSCADADACNGAETCQAGACTSGAAVTCNTPPACHTAVGATCDSGSGACTYPSLADGTSCADADACNGAETCQAGACTPGTATVCTASDQCHVAGTCDTGTGVCSNPLANDGTTCSDNNACTTGDTCQTGACAPGTATVCTASDQCHVAGTCDTGTGVCSNPAKADGTTCSDANACTTGDTCQAGACTPGTATVCTASDQCHVAGICDTGTGVCSNPSATNGAACTDGNACTTGDTCQTGACTPGTPTVCTASDQCHVAGVCDTGTGVCSNPPKANGSVCSDANACTAGDTCQTGACTPGTATVCTASDQCHVAGVCDTGTGVCSNPPKANGTTCTDANACTTGDTCQTGVCAPGTATVCTASDQCHVAGICNTGTGVCSNPIATNGTTCTDGNACTTGDSCQSGGCVGVAVPPPAEIQGLAISRSHPTKLAWTAAGAGIYDLATSTLSDLRLNGTATATCLSNDHAGASYNDNSPDPAPNDGYYYIVRAQGTCGPGTYGSASTGVERAPTNACP